MPDSSDVTVRIATADDARQIAQVGRIAFRETFADSTSPANLEHFLRTTYTESIIMDDLSDPRARYLVATFQGEVVGFAKVLDGSETACVAARRPMEFCRLYVLGNRIGRGVGAALMNAGLEHARANAHDVVWLGVWERNHRARSFYERWGFQLVGSHTFTVGSDDQLDNILKLRLDKTRDLAPKSRHDEGTTSSAAEAE